MLRSAGAAVAVLALGMIAAVANYAPQTFAQSAAEAREARPVTEIFDRLQIGKTTLVDAKSLLGTARPVSPALTEFSVGGYLAKVVVSVDDKRSGSPLGSLLALSIEVEKPKRIRDPNPVTLNGYWTPKSCNPAGACRFELGTDIPLHLAKLRDLGLNRTCNPVLLSGDAVMRYVCAGSKANGQIDVEVDADLRYGLKNELALRAERALIMMKVRLIENDPNNPDRGGAAAWRRQFGIMGPITNEAIWNLVQELPVAAYGIANKAAIDRQR